MSDFFENEKEIESIEEVSSVEETAKKIEDDEESTIFSAPTEKKPYAKKGSKKKILSVVAAVLSVVILASGLFVVSKFISKKKTITPQDGAASKEIEVLTLDYKWLDKVTVKNSNGNFVFTCDRKTETSSTGEETVTADWLTEGFDKDKLSSLLISDVLDTLDNITATREITKKSAEDCGLLEPTRKIDVESEKYGNFSVLIGSDSPDNGGVYLKLSTKDTIYLVNSDIGTGFDFDYLDLANVSGFNALDTKGLEKYLNQEGQLALFDRLIVSGKNFPSPIVFEQNTDGFLKDFIPYKVVSPVKQDADNLSNLMSLFINGLVSEGAYSLDINAEELKKVGLDNPDISVKIELGGKTRTFMISKVDDQYCAVIADESKMIEKVKLTDISFIDYTIDDFYSKWVFLRAIDDVKTMTFDLGGKKYSFDISYTDSEDVKTYHVKLGDKKITADYFQDFYTEFISLQTVDFITEPTELSPEMTVTMNYKDGHTETIAFTRTAPTKYQYTIDGVLRGRITSSSYNKVLKYLKLIVENKPIK